MPAIQSDLKTLPISWLIQNHKAKSINTDIEIQRKEVWDDLKKSNLIVSILLDVPIENLLFEEDGENEGTPKYKVLDGQQRVKAIAAFVTAPAPAKGGGDKAGKKSKEPPVFRLHEKIKNPQIDGIDIRGKSFYELPVNMQDKINNFLLPITVLRPLDDEQRSLVFFMRNQGVPLTNLEISRAVIGPEGMKKLTELARHPFMTTKVKITEPARNKYVDIRVLIEYIMLKKLGPEAEFTKGKIEEFSANIHTDPSLVDVARITKTMDYLDKAFDKKRKHLKKQVLPMLLVVAEQAVGVVEEAVFAEWVDTTFPTLEEDAEYGKTMKSYKIGDVQQRMGIIQKGVDKLLKDKK